MKSLLAIGILNSTVQKRLRRQQLPRAHYAQDERDENAGMDKTAQGHKTTRRASAMYPVTMAGFAAFFAWFLVFAFGTPAAMQADAQPLARLLPKACLFIALLVGSLFTKLLPQRVEHFLGRRWCGGALLAVCCLCSLSLFLARGSFSMNALAPAPTAIFFIVVHVVAGLIAGFGFLAWHAMGIRFSHDAILYFEGASTAAGALASAAVLEWVPSMFLSCASTAAGALSLAAWVWASTGARARSAQLESNSAPKRDRKQVASHLDRRFRALFIVLNCMFGLAWCLVHATVTDACLPLLAAGMCLLVLVVATRGQKGVPDRYVMLLMRACLAAAVISPFVFATGYGPCLAVSKCLLVASWSICWAIDMSLLLQQAHEFSLSAVKHTANSMVINNAGFLAGWCAGTVAVALHVPGSPLETPVSLALAVVVTLLGAWLIPLNTYSSPDKVIAKQAETARRRSEMQRGSDTRSAQMAHAASRYELTEREQDVLIWLVRGRTAKAISKELDVSESTAKTHIYNIYKKTGVHSQQELITLIESL